MKYIVTAVPISPTTRRRTGKSYIQVVEWKAKDPDTAPAEVERFFESQMKAMGKDVKVVDVRRAE